MFMIGVTFFIMTCSTFDGSTNCRLCLFLVYPSPLIKDRCSVKERTDIHLITNLGGRPGTGSGRWLLLLWYVCLLIPAVFQTGCDTAISPFAESDRYFSIYGYLDTGADTQFVRVVALRDSIFTSDDPLEATVTTTDFETGRMIVWKDSVVSFYNYRDDTGHVFWTKDKPEAGHVYRLNVERPDGAVSYADVRIPEAPDDPVVTRPVTYGNTVWQHIEWSESFNAPVVDMVYHVRDTSRTGSETEIVLSYVDAFVSADGRSEVSISMTQDTELVYKGLDLPQSTRLARIELLGVEIRIARASEDWTFLGSKLDYETLAFPGKFSNVTQGFGFIGAIIHTSYSWIIPPDDMILLGYTDGQGK